MRTWYSQLIDSKLFITNGLIYINIGMPSSKFINRLADREIERRNTDQHAVGFIFYNDDIKRFIKWGMHFIHKLSKRHEISIKHYVCYDMASIVVAKCIKYFIPNPSSGFMHYLLKSLYYAFDTYRRDIDKKVSYDFDVPISDKLIIKSTYNTLSKITDHSKIRDVIHVDLKLRYKEILRLRYEQRYTLAEIGAKYGVTRERARQLLVKAISRLRIAHGLEDKGKNVRLINSIKRCKVAQSIISYVRDGEKEQRDVFNYLTNKHSSSKVKLYPKLFRLLTHNIITKRCEKVRSDGRNKVLRWLSVNENVINDYMII